MTDMINKPSHYIDKSGIECIEITRHCRFCVGNCFKYLYRAGKKGDIKEDLNKARKYAEWANENREVIPKHISYKVNKVAECRNDEIRLVMLEMADVNNYNWVKVIKAIDYAIAVSAKNATTEAGKNE